MTLMTRMTKETKLSILSIKLARILIRAVLRISISVSNERLRDLARDRLLIEMIGIEEIERKNQGIEDLVVIRAVKVPYREIRETNQGGKDLIDIIMTEGRGKAHEIQRVQKR